MSKQTNATAISTIGVDTGKNTLHLVGLDRQGTIVLREKLARSRIGTRLANVPPCLIGIEAGMATHYVARELLALGHNVKQVPRICIPEVVLVSVTERLGVRRRLQVQLIVSLDWNAACRRPLHSFRNRTGCDLAWSASGRL
jgi:transposase